MGDGKASPIFIYVMWLPSLTVGLEPGISCPRIFRQQIILSFPTPTPDGRLL